MRPVKEIRQHKKLALFLFSLLTANPAVLFLLTHSAIISVVVPILVFGVLSLSHQYFRTNLISVYLVNIFAILSIFLHAEVIFSLYSPNRIIDNLYLIRDGYDFNKPNLSKKFSDKEYAAAYTTNCQGYRIPDGMNQDNRINTTDWLFIGDSYTQGAQVSFEQLYTTLLHQKYPNRVILNVGISGAGIAEELKYYIDQGQKLSPSVVILQLCSFNDFMNVGAGMRRNLTDYFVYYSNFLRYLLQGLKYQDSDELPLRRWTEPFKKDSRSNSDYNVFYKNGSERQKRDLDLFAEYLNRFNEETKKRNSKLIVFLIPTREQVDINSLQEVLDAYHIKPSELDMLRPNKILKELTERLGIIFVDMLDAFRASSTSAFFRYDEHLTIAGHEILATELSKVLAPGQEVLPIILSKKLSGDRYPTYSDDAATVIFQSPCEGKMELFRTDPEFREIKRLTVNNINESHPFLSHGGSWLAFTQGDAETLQTKVIISSVNDINNWNDILDDDDTYGAIPSFSPDDRFLAYAEWRRVGKTHYSNPQIAVIDLHTREKRYITDDNRESWRPVFSPDGKRIIYIAKHKGQFDLYLYTLDEDREDRLTWTPHDEWDPQFSRDGRYVVYSANPEKNWDLFVIDLPNGETYRLTRTKGDEWDPSFGPSVDTIIFAGRFGLMEGIYLTSFYKDSHKR